MKKTYLKLIKGLSLAVSGILFSSSIFAQTTTFNFTGGIQTYTVPCGVTQVFIQTWGAQGGSGEIGGAGVFGGAGGLGGYSEGFLNVTPGDILNIFVGGQGATPTGGFNGGANGGSTNAGGGGGATDVRITGTTEANRVITAGGGGGGGRGGCDEGSAATGGIGGTGGVGGGGVGVSGLDSPTSGGVAGGGSGGNFGSVQGGSGPAGIGCGGFLGAPGSISATGTGANGGAGQSCCCSSQNSIPGGGGGGGGQIGGGGGGGGSAGTTGCSGNSKGAGGGGGGGSCYIAGVSSGVVNNGIWLGNGMCTISWSDPLPVAPSLLPASICANAITPISVSAVANATSYTWTATGDIIIESGQGSENITISSIGVGGTLSVFASNACGDGPLSTVETITVFAQPIVGLTATMTGTFCGGQDVTLTGSPAGGVYSVVSGPTAALTANVFNAPTSGSWTVDYTFTDGNGCSNNSTLDFIIDCMLEIDVINANGNLTIFPNPNNGNFTLKSDLNSAGTLELYNLAGQLVHTQIIDDLSEKMIEIKDLTPGAYTMKIKSEDQLFTVKMNIIK